MDIMQTRRKRSKKSYRNKTDENQSQFHHCTELSAEILDEMGVAALVEVPADHGNKAKTLNCRKLQQVPKQADNMNIYHTPENASSRRLVNSFTLKFNSLACKHGEDHFIRLSDEILLHIFKWLPKCVLAKCALVCKRWKAVSYDECLWKTIDLGKKCLKPGVLESVIGRGVVALRLSMASEKVPLTEDDSFSRNLESNHRLSKLQYLDLSMAILSQPTLNYLFSVCLQLKKVSLEGCMINNRICCHLSANSNLRTLNLSMCRGLEIEGLFAIMKNCLQLSSLNLAWTDLSLKGMDVLCKNIPIRMKELNISGYRQILCDQNVIEVTRRCPNLVKFDVSDSPKLTPFSLEAIKTLKSLQCLHISRCYNISPTSYHSLSDLKGLKSLTIHGILSDNVLPAIGCHLKPIQINKELFSTIARPTFDIRTASIWGIILYD